jgi:nucleotide-binding universal stress UspA family protein
MRAAKMERTDPNPAIANTVRAAMRRGATQVRRPKAPPPFSDILCAVDGSRGSTEAVHQAIALCGSAASLHLVAVYHELRSGRHAQVDLSERRAQEALDEAARTAHQAGVEVSIELLHGAPTSDLLLAEAAEHDLLVVGCHGGSRVGGIMMGSTATQVAHRAEGPVMITRRTDDAKEFPQSILVATDGSPGSWAAASVATGLSQALGSELRLVYVPDGMHPERYREVLKQLAVVEKATGAAPPVVDSPGHVAERIGEAAHAAQSSLIVIGRRGVAGLKALGSVSERVVHKAQCSVLVVPLQSD